MMRLEAEKTHKNEKNCAEKVVDQPVKTVVSEPSISFEEDKKEKLNKKKVVV